MNHPAHVHLFKNIIWELEKRGYDIYVTSREKEVTTELLERYNINHHTLTSVNGSLLGLASEFFSKEIALLQFSKKINPDVYLGSNPAICHISSILGGKSIIFHDTEPSRIREYLFKPFADVILTPENFSKHLGETQVRYPSYHELAYLHPDNFRPSKQLLISHGIQPDETYYILRFIAWDAHHDVGQSGFTLEGKRELISLLSNYGKVYISSEQELPPEFKEYSLPIPPHLVHHLLYFADLYVGESGTMSTEAAVMGTPAVMCNSFAAGSMSNFIELEERYGLLFTAPEPSAAIQYVNEILTKNDADWTEKRNQLLDEKSNLVPFVVDLIDRDGEHGA